MGKPKHATKDPGSNDIRLHTLETGGRECEHTGRRCAGAHPNCLTLGCKWAYLMKGLPLPETAVAFIPHDAQPTTQPSAVY